jgi:predicted metalloendopeptidase
MTMRNTILMSAACAALSLAACDDDGAAVEASLAPTPEEMAAGAPATGAPEAEGVTFGSFGVDLEQMDAAIHPGDDFYRYVNGVWLDTFTIPADRTNYGVFTALDEAAEEQVRVIVEEAAAAQAPAGSPAQKIGGLYKSWMDADRVEQLGLAPLQADLDRLAALPDKDAVARVMGDPALGASSIVGAYVDVDAMNTSRYVLYLTQAGLGLPNRDYYLQEGERFDQIRAGYVDYVETLFGLTGIAGGREKAETIMALETRMAEAHWEPAKRRDRDLTYNPVTAQGLAEYAPGFPWAVMLESAGLSAQEDFVLAENDAVQTLAGIFDETPLETWRDYLVFHFVNTHASYLPRPFDDAKFDFFNRTLNGQPEQRERWKRGIDLIDSVLGEAVGRIYVDRHFPPDARAQMQELVETLRGAFARRLDEGVEWMSEGTKEEARAKLAAFTPKIGYPDEWETYDGLEIRDGDLIGNIRRANVWQWMDELAKLGAPIDRDEWFMTPQTVNAYYNPEMNEIVFPAAILQPPFFDPEADPAVNYGAIGAVIGHEMGHGFDDQGRKSDGTGLLRDWWTEGDARRFDERAQMLGEQYAQYEPVPGHFVKPDFTMGENLGDLGGLNIAYEAYRLSLNGQEPPVLGGFTGDQRFFMSWAQVWRRLYREEELINRLTADPHSPSEYRTNGVVRNMDAWYEAFGVGPDHALYLPPEDRVTVW